ncbi:unnamed protein product [Camellia sinensis]
MEIFRGLRPVTYMFWTCITQYAIVETIDGPNKYSGTSAVLSVHQPDVVGKQYSAGRMMIQNGPDSLQVGWRVDPSLFGDARQSHCFNTNCPGFVIVGTDIPLGSVSGKVSIRGGIPVEVEIYILQDLANGNWWLGVANTNVGFWPKRILDGGLANLASHVEWGGEVFSPLGTPKPAMGGGHFLIESTSYDAYSRSIALKSPSGGDTHTYEFTNSIKLYDVKDEGNRGAYFGHVVLYGGHAECMGQMKTKKVHSLLWSTFLGCLACRIKSQLMILDASVVLAPDKASLRTNPLRYSQPPRQGPLPRKFASSTRTRTRDHLLQRLELLQLMPTFVGPTTSSVYI